MKLTDSNLDIASIKKCVFDGETIEIDREVYAKIDSCFDFLKRFSKDRVIYGINTGFGPMAQWRIDDRHLADLQYNIIRSHATANW